MSWVSPGDREGFVAAFINNLVQLLIIAPLCTLVLGFSPELIYGQILPGVAVSFLVGNLFYAWQAKRLSEKENRDDVCALPYGISTPAIFAHIFLVMLPAKNIAIAQGMENPERIAWHAGIVACALGGLLEIAGAFFANWIRRHTPQAAMLATLGGVGLGFLGLAFLFQLFSAPLVGLVSLALVFIIFFGRVSFRTNIPDTLIILAAGTACAWITGLAPVGQSNSSPLDGLGVYLPVPVFQDLWQAFQGGHILAYLSVVIPIGLLGVLASLQNIESAAAAGDDYPVKPSLIVNGLGTLAAACFGSPFPTSIYIGHPAWKKLGARRSYSVLNGVAVTLVCLSGTMALLAWAVPAEAGIAIILWIGIIIAVQAFEVTPIRHYPAVMIGLFPALAAWVMLLIKSSVTAAGASIDYALVENAHAVGSFIGGGFHLEQGFLYSAMIWAAIVVCIIDQHWKRAAVWSLVGASLSAVGLMHSYILNGYDSVIHLPLLSSLINGGTASNAGAGIEPSNTPAAQEIAFAYFGIAVLFFLTPSLIKKQTDLS